MIRWALKSSELNIEWEHRTGSQNVVVNVLSWNPVGNMDGSQISCAVLRALALNSREQLIREQREDPELEHIYRYLENPDDGSVNATVCEGLPSEAEEENCDLIVLDDMMNDVTSEISQMFTMGSHHKKYSIILITQNLFPRVKSMRDISLNAHYIILFRNNRDVSQAACFGRQAFPGRGKFFMDSYKKVTEEPFSYLLVDVHPRSPEVQRLPAASPAQRKAILKSATDDQIKTLCEICDNLLSGNIPTKKIEKLCSYKRVIRLLANRSVPISRKRGIAGKAIGKRI
ncbi:uncharacterized protein TNCV_3794541 [Trichonephila clavipes]|nr:uncharacterized protein TNCV_3794541 [Trichonephila clavipes]